MKLIIALALAILASPAHAFSCEDVVYAQSHWNAVAIKAAAALATPEQKQQAADCLKNQKGGGSHPVHSGPNDAKPQPVKVKHAKVRKVKPAAAPLPEPHNPVTHSSVRTQPTVNPPVAVSTPDLPQEKPMSFSWLIPVFAVLGVMYFTFAVGKYGVVPVFSKIASWWNSGKADVIALENRVKSLEARVYGGGGAKVVAPTGATGSG